MDYYKVKNTDYFTGVRLDLLSLLPTNPSQKVLEVGAGGGNTLAYIKEQKMASEVVGADLYKIENSLQESSLIDKFIIIDIEHSELELPEAYFDVIILADVLEHLVDPWTTIDKLTKHLKTEGILLVSLPNIREITTLFKIALQGDFRYNPEGGILDKTHLRFFCKKNMLALFNEKEYLKVEYNCPSFLRWGGYGMKKRKWLNMLTLGLFKQFLAIQYLLVVRKKS